MKITLEHATTLVEGKKAPFCRKGIRLFFEKYNLDYDEFRKNGIEESELLKTNDSMAKQVVGVARGRR